MRVAITGASGFIGRYVLAELEHSQAEIYAVTRDATRLNNISAGIHVVEMDIASPGEECFDRIGSPDVLIHLAWDGLPNYTSLHHFESELPKHYLFLKGLIDAGLSSLLAAGTCFEYGMQSGSLPEDITPCPNNPYGYAKNALRQHLEYLQSAKPFNLTWARFFYMFGEGQSGSSLYSKLKDAMLCGAPVFDMSGGEQLRDYLPVSEVARAIVGLALSGKNIGTINLCSGRPISVRRLVEQWLKENGCEMKLNLGHYPYLEYEPMAFWGDRRRLDSILVNK